MSLSQSLLQDFQKQSGKTGTALDGQRGSSSIRLLEGMQSGAFKDQPAFKPTGAEPIYQPTPQPQQNVFSMAYNAAKNKLVQFKQALDTPEERQQIGQNIVQGAKDLGKGLFGGGEVRDVTQKPESLQHLTESQYNSLVNQVQQERENVALMLDEAIKKQRELEAIEMKSGIGKQVSNQFRTGVAGLSPELVENYATVKKLNDNLYIYDKFLGKEKVDKGTIPTIVDNLLRDPMMLIPFSEAKDTLDRYLPAVNAYRKLEAGEELSQAEKVDISVLHADMVKAALDNNLGSMVGDIVTEAIPYMMLFGLTAPIEKSVTTGVKNKIITSATESMVSQGVKSLAAKSIGIAAQNTIGFAPTIAGETAQYMLPNYQVLGDDNGEAIITAAGGEDGFTKALSKAWLSNYVELASERVGELIQPGVSKIFDKVNDFLPKAIVARFAQLRGITSSETMTQLAKQVGWNGFIGEVFEEEIAELLQAPIQERDYYAPFLTKEGTERLLVTTLSIGAMSGFASTINMAANTLNSNGQPKLPPIDIEIGIDTSNKQEVDMRRNTQLMKDPDVWEDVEKTKEALGTKEGADATRTELENQLFDAKEKISQQGGRNQADTYLIIQERDAVRGLKAIDNIYDFLPSADSSQLDYSSTQLDLPDAEAQQVRSFAESIPEADLNLEEGGRELEPHVTVLYGLETTNQADIEQLLEGVEPIEIELGETSVFNREGYDVLKIDVISKRLEDLHSKIDKALDTPGQTFPDYKPHVTIAYLKPEASSKYTGDNRFSGTKITMNELTFSTKDGNRFSIPLTGKATESVQADQDVPQEQKAKSVQEQRTDYAEDTDNVIRVANKKMFRGSKGAVKQLKKTFEKTLVIDTNQYDLMKKLADMGNVAAKEHIDSLPEGVVRVDFKISDPIIREAYQGSYDAIQYNNDQMKQIGQEWHDLKANQFFAQEKLVAEQYAKQNRGGKYKPTKRQVAAKKQEAEPAAKEETLSQLQARADKLKAVYQETKSGDDLRAWRKLQNEVNDRQAAKIAGEEKQKNIEQQKKDTELRKADKTIDAISKEDTDLLLTEAKKHKTFEEFRAMMRGSATQYGEYKPKLRKFVRSESVSVGDIAGLNPNTTITVYRGIDAKSVAGKKIGTGDFVTTDFDDATQYTDSPSKVISRKAKLKDLVAEYPDEVDITDPKNPVSYELIYSPGSKVVKITDTKLSEIWNQANKPAEKVTKKKAVKEAPGTKKQPKTAYKRGQITQLERQLDEMLGTTSFISSGKWQARVAARSTARKQLEYYAEQGDASAVKYLQQVEDIESAIADARTAREIQTEQRTKVAEFESVNSGVAEQNALASKGAVKLHNFELRAEPKPDTPEFKLYQKVQALIKKYAQSIGEGYTPRGALGVYYQNTKNIRVNAVNDLSVVSHEVAHFLDYAHNISERLDAKANKLDKTLQKQLGDLYVQYYHGAKDTHSNRLKRVEGFATLLQKYTEMPTTITKEYPELVQHFLQPGGKHYHSVIGDILKDLNGIISDYQGLSALDRIGARVSSEGTGIEQKSFLNFWQKIRTQIADQVYPVEVIATRANKQMTAEDPSLWTRAYNSVSGVVNNNISTDRGYWSFTGLQEGFQKKFDYNWKTLIDSLENRKISDDFSYYLVARRQHETYLELDKLEGMYESTKLINDAMQAIDSKKYAESEKYRQKHRDVIAQLDDMGIEVTPKNIDRAKAGIAKATENAKKEFEDLKGILERDSFAREDVDAAYEQNRDRFKDEEAMFDALSREDLNLLFHQDVQLIDKKKFTRLASKKGYASFKRQFYDEIVGAFDGEMQVSVGQTRVSSMIGRKGSQRTIINPLFSALQSHSEITRKAMRQVVYNQIGKIGYSAIMPDLFQETQLKVSVDKETGAVSYPQEKDSNIVMTRRGYKRVPVLVNKEVKNVIDGVLDYKNIDTFTQLYTGMSRAFTAGTTGFYPAFALSNFVVDQMTATANSYNKFKPLYTPMSEMLKVIRNRSSIEAKYYEEYLVMGGERQTFTGWQKLTPKEMISRVNGEKKRMKQAIAAMQKGTDILSMPAAKSEIFTRASEYINARKAGKSQVVALEEAGRVSAPFHHVGKWGGEKGETFIRGLPYFNAVIQVIDQQSRVLSTKSGRTRYAFMTLAITAAYLTSMMALMSASDDQKDQYRDLEAEELARYIYMPNPSGTGLIRMRMPENMTVPGTIINMIIADKMMGAKYDAQDYMQAATAFLPDQFNPLDPAKQLLSWIPQIFKPTAHVIFNKKEYPRVTDLVSQGMSRKPAPLQFNEGTSGMAKKIGEWFNLSPIKVDYWITGTFGRASGFFMGKPGVYNPATSFMRDHYFTSGRLVRDYYEKKTENDGRYTAYQNFEKGFTDLPREDIKEIYRVKMISDQVDDLLGKYYDIDIEVEQEKAAKIRERIYFLLERIEDGSTPSTFNQWAGDASERRRKNRLK